MVGIPPPSGAFGQFRHNDPYRIFWQAQRRNRQSVDWVNSAVGRTINRGLDHGQESFEVKFRTLELCIIRRTYTVILDRQKIMTDGL